MMAASDSNDSHEYIQKWAGSNLENRVPMRTEPPYGLQDDFQTQEYLKMFPERSKGRYKNGPVEDTKWSRGGHNLASRPSNWTSQVATATMRPSGSV